VKTLVADSQYSSGRLREKLSAYGVEAVIPYPANSVQERKVCCAWMSTSEPADQPRREEFTGGGPQLNG
jgi:hypothetical protein